MILSTTILWMFAALFLVSLCTGHDHKQNPNASLKLDDQLSISWTINPGKKTIRFKVKAAIDETGWFLIGFEPQKPTVPKNVAGTKGDAFVVWRRIVNSKKKKTYSWNVTDCNTFHGGIQKDQKQNYHLPKNLIKTMYNETSNILTAIVWRKLDTQDKEDVVIKKGAMFHVFGSHNNEKPSKKWRNELQEIKGVMYDVFLQASNVSFFDAPKGKKDGGNFVKSAGQLAEQHWIGLVVGTSAFLTILITCTVYCLSKRAGGIKRKHVSMSFHREHEYDDEAKVAFLQSEET